MNAESAYLFRHALLRDAAYQLQLPGDRARLHGLAFEAMEALAGGRAPAGATERHPTDAIALELSEHARLGEVASGAQELYLRRAAAHAEREYRAEASVRLWERHAGVVEGAERGDSLRRAALAAFRAGQFPAAESLCRRALAIHREAGDRGREGVALADLADFLRQVGRLPEAESLLVEALAIHRGAPDRSFVGGVLSSLAGIYAETGRVEPARAHHEQALAAFAEAGDRRSESASRAIRASLFREAGQVDRAERELEAALVLHRAAGDRRSEASNLGSLAALANDSGRPEAAERRYGQALEAKTASMRRACEKAGVPPFGDEG